MLLQITLYLTLEMKSYLNLVRFFFPNCDPFELSNKQICRSSWLQSISMENGVGFC